VALTTGLTDEEEEEHGDTTQQNGATSAVPL